jgi:hypothetical protein
MLESATAEDDNRYKLLNEIFELSKIIQPIRQQIFGL